MEKMYHRDGMLSKDAVLKGLQAGGRRKDRGTRDDRRTNVRSPVGSDHANYLIFKG
jgi:hypothetical protein